MEILFFLAITMVLPLYLGMLYNKVLIKKEDDGLNTYLVGIFLLFSAFEIVCVPGIKLDLSLEKTNVVYAGLIFVLLLVSLFACRNEASHLIGRIQQMFKIDRSTLLPIVLCGLLCLEGWKYASYDYYDTILETTKTTIATNSVYRINPLTGSEMVNGMYPINQLFTLPIFYAVLCEMSGMEAEVLVDKMIPMWIVLVHLMIVWGYARRAGAKKNFVAYYAGLLLFSENAANDEAFSLLHQGYTGNSILLAVLIPGAALLLYHAWNQKSNVVSRLFLMGVTVCAGGFLLYLPGIENLYSIDLMFPVLSLLYVVAVKREWSRKNWLLFLAISLLACVCNATPALGAYVLSDVCERYKSSKGKWAMVTATWLLVVFSGSVLLYPNGDAIKVKQQKNFPEQQVVDYIVDLSEELEFPLLVGPRAIMQEIRKVDADILLPYGRDYWEPSLNNEIADIYDEQAYALYAGIVDMEVSVWKAMEQGVEVSVDDSLMRSISNLAWNKECTIFVTMDELPDIVEPWALLKEIKGYYIYAVLQ